MFLEYVHNVWLISCELSPWLLLGLLAAGLMHVLLPSDFVHRHLGKHGLGSIFKAVGLGVPMPLCSCSVIPAAAGLRRDGASTGAAMGFMVSTPQTGIDSILVSASFLGWPFAVFKVVSAMVTGIIGGVLAEQIGGAKAESIANAQPESTCDTGANPPGKWRTLGSYSFELFNMLWGYLLIGVLVAALVSTLVPPGALTEHRWSHGLSAALIMLLLSLPMYVCATGSVAIAASLVTAGMPAGAALVFLMAGPASNLATMGAVSRIFGRRVLAVYLGVLAVGSLACGMFFDALIVPTVAANAYHHGDHSPGMWAIFTTVIVFLLMTWCAIAAARRKFNASATVDDIVLQVSGMNCRSCVSAIERELTPLEGVQSVLVDLDKGRVSVNGKAASRPAIVGAIRALGYTVDDAGQCCH